MKTKLKDFICTANYKRNLKIGLNSVFAYLQILGGRLPKIIINFDCRIFYSNFLNVLKNVIQAQLIIILFFSQVTERIYVKDNSKD